MKQLYTLLLFLFCMPSLQAQQQLSPAAQFKKLSWLTGTWARTNVKPGNTAHERWESAGNALKGYGVTLRGKDTAFIEKLSIIIKDDAVYYVADVKENQQPVFFRMTTISEDGFVCENPGHDFPKRITYMHEGNKLRAVISGNGKEMGYWFERR